MRLENATVLLVDDLPTLRELFAAWLSRSGCAVLTTHDGAEALRLLTTQKVDAVISDIGMPVMDGVTLAERIRDLQLATPVLLFSGFDLDEQQCRKLYAMGVEAVMTKPLDRQKLLQALDSSLKPVEERWVDPVAKPVVDGPFETITVKCENHSEDGESPRCLIGRGGCAFLSPKPLETGQLLDLEISFPNDGPALKDHIAQAQLMKAHVLRTQVRVRWFDTKTNWAGVEFLYIEPESRPLLLDAMADVDPFSYIPSP